MDIIWIIKNMMNKNTRKIFAVIILSFFVFGFGESVFAEERVKYKIYNNVMSESDAIANECNAVSGCHSDSMYCAIVGKKLGGNNLTGALFSVVGGLDFGACLDRDSYCNYSNTVSADNPEYAPEKNDISSKKIPNSTDLKDAEHIGCGSPKSTGDTGDNSGGGLFGGSAGFSRPNAGDIGVMDFSSSKDLLDRVVNFALGFVSIVTICMFIYAGFMYITSGMVDGNDEKAKKSIVGAVIGVLIILSSWTIVNTITGIDVGGSASDRTDRSIVFFFSRGGDKGGSFGPVFEGAANAKNLPNNEFRNAQIGLYGTTAMFSCQKYENGLKFVTETVMMKRPGQEYRVECDRGTGQSEYTIWYGN
jgi:hypothetical protein